MLATEKDLKNHIASIQARRTRINISFSALQLLLFGGLLIGAFVCGCVDDVESGCTSDSQCRIGRLCIEQQCQDRGFTFVTAGTSHTCALDSTSKVTCWGSDHVGESSPPVSHLVSVAAGDGFTCGIDPNGELVCWGRDDYGQASPPRGGFTQVTSGLDHACALREDSTVVCWGADGTLGVPLPSSRFIEISAGNYHTCGLTLEKRVVCWGFELPGSPQPQNETFSSISTSGTYACGVSNETGALKCWGEPPEGTPYGEFSLVSTAVFHACALYKGGLATCWGRNGAGRTDAPPHTFRQISLSTYHSCGLTVSGDIECWGANSEGQLTR